MLLFFLDYIRAFLPFSDEDAILFTGLHFDKNVAIGNAVLYVIFEACYNFVAFFEGNVPGNYEFEFHKLITAGGPAFKIVELTETIDVLTQLL